MGTKTIIIVMSAISITGVGYFLYLKKGGSLLSSSGTSSRLSQTTKGTGVVSGDAKNTTSPDGASLVDSGKATTTRKPSTGANTTPRSTEVISGTRESYYGIKI